MSKWDELSLAEKAVMIGAAVRQGYTSLPEIRQKYNQFAEGGLLDNAANEYAKGGGIHIEDSKKGTFTAAASKHGMGVQEFASKVLAHPENYSPAMRKKANFARNSKKWKHGEGRHLYDGESEDTQQMVLGKKYWQSQTGQPAFYEEMTEFNRKQEEERKKKAAALRQWADTKGKEIAEKRARDYNTASNDNAWIDYNYTAKKPKNKHLSERAEQGAKAHAAWVEEHPVLNAWGMAASAAPFAVAAAPFAVAAGDALASTTLGQAATSGLGYVANAAKATPWVASSLPWVNAGLTSWFGAEGVQDALVGNFTPMSVLEVLPLTQAAKPTA